MLCRWQIFDSLCLIDPNRKKIVAIKSWYIKLRKEMGNVPKRQQPDHRADKSRRSPTSLQCNEKFPHPEASFSWPLNKYILVQ